MNGLFDLLYHISKFPSFLRTNNIPLYFYTHFVYPFIVDGWLVAFTFWLLWIMLLWTWVTLLSILWGIYAEIELLDHIVILFLIFWGPIIWFSNVVAPFYIPSQQCISVFSSSVVISVNNQSWGSLRETDILKDKALFHPPLYPRHSDRSHWEEFFYVAFILFPFNFCNSVAAPVFPTRQVYWQTSEVLFCGEHVSLP